jgi:protein-disulfide isomerase
MTDLKPAVHATDHHAGNINAEIVLVEYGDYECPYCGRAYPLIKRLLDEKGDDFHFVFRNFPLREIHPYAYISAITAEAAGKQGKFWEMHDLIFENQKKLNAFFLLSLSRSLDLDYIQFTKYSKSPEVESRIETDIESGVRSGVNGTPSFFINGMRLETYDETYDSLLDAIQLKSEIIQPFNR